MHQTRPIRPYLFSSTAAATGSGYRRQGLLLGPRTVAAVGRNSRADTCLPTKSNSHARLCRWGGEGGGSGIYRCRAAPSVLARCLHWTAAQRSSSSSPWSQIHPIVNAHRFGEPDKFDSGGRAAGMKGIGPRGHSPEEIPPLSHFERPLLIEPSQQELVKHAEPMQIVMQRCEGIRWRVFGNVRPSLDQFLCFQSGAGVCA